MAKILVIAGGEWQCPLIKKIKNMGHEVMCSNLLENSPAFEYSDYSRVANVLDKETNLKIAREYCPDAVATDQSDIAVPTVAFVAESLNLKGIGTKTAELFTNKYKMREFCEQHGFSTPRYKLCRDYEEARELLDELGKIIIKPIDSQSSRGVFLINSQKELKEKFAETRKYSNAEEVVLAEQYIEGREFTVDGIKTDDEYWVTAISKKSHFNYNSAIAKELLFSNDDREYDYERLRRENRELVLKMRLPFGLTHAEYKYMDGKFYLIEIAARGGGTKISSDIVPFISGIDSNKIYIDTLLGKAVNISINYAEQRYALLGFFDFEPGKVQKIVGLEDAKKLKGLIEVRLNFKEGDTIYRAGDDRSRLGHFIIGTNSYEKLRELETQVKGLIKIEYEVMR